MRATCWGVVALLGLVGIISREPAGATLVHLSRSMNV